MENCLFCNIVNKTINANIVYESDTALAFMDIAPQAPVHILIIPKSHLESMRDINSSHHILIGEMLTAATGLAKKFGIHNSGYRLITNAGDDAGQTVGHLHFHLMGGKDLGPKLSRD